MFDIQKYKGAAADTPEQTHRRLQFIASEILKDHDTLKDIENVYVKMLDSRNKLGPSLQQWRDKLDRSISKLEININKMKDKIQERTMRFFKIFNHGTYNEKQKLDILHTFSKMYKLPRSF